MSQFFALLVYCEEASFSFMNKKIVRGTQPKINTREPGIENRVISYKFYQNRKLRWLMLNNNFKLLSLSSKMPKEVSSHQGVRTPCSHHYLLNIIYYPIPKPSSHCYGLFVFVLKKVP